MSAPTPRPWLADIPLEDELAARLIARQFPRLAPVRIEPLGTGWDNAAYLVNGDTVFRFPRRRVAAAWLDNENRVLPRLAPRLPLAVPVPEYVGRPDHEYPCSFAGYRMLPGSTGCSVDAGARSRHNARALGALLAVLHSPGTVAELGDIAIGDDIGRADLQRRATLLCERLPGIDAAARAAGVDSAAIGAEARRLATTPAWSQAPRWVHGDLYARHLLVDDHARLCGIIDWGDVHRGDPALDLSIAFTFVPPHARPAFMAAYGAMDPATRARARFHALHYGVALTYYGLDVDDRALVSAGLQALSHAVTGHEPA